MAASFWRACCCALLPDELHEASVRPPIIIATDAQMIRVFGRVRAASGGISPPFLRGTKVRRLEEYPPALRVTCPAPRWTMEQQGGCSDLVGTAGFEPATSASRTLRATKLRHVPSGAPV